MLEGKSAKVSASIMYSSSASSNSTIDDLHYSQDIFPLKQYGEADVLKSVRSVGGVTSYCSSL
jgi:hypothetical protein